jgi:NADH dehydrogenase FAD-containing subunit
MAFADDFASCLSPLPTPGQLGDSLSDLLEFLHKLHSAWEASGGDDEMLLTALVAGGALGIDEATASALAAAAGVTVVAYLAACISCAVVAAGPAIWSAIASSDDDYIKNQLQLAANDKGIAPPDTATA